MKLTLVLLVVLPLVLATPAEEKRILEFLHLDGLVNQLNAVVHGGMGHDACVVACQKFSGAISFLCDTACTTALAAIPNSSPPSQYLYLDGLVNQLNAVVHGGMGHDACVAACQKFSGAISFLCDTACSTVLAAFRTA